MLKRIPISSTNRPLDVVMHWRDRGDLKLDCDYQRGDVWGPTRQVNLIRSVLLGIPIPSIIVNDRHNAEWQREGDPYAFAVIDGKQRITALLKFMDGELAVPGEWFDLEGEVTFDHIGEVNQRRFRHRTIPFAEGQLPTIEQEREVFELVNFGGVPQGETDIPNG